MEGEAGSPQAPKTPLMEDRLGSATLEGTGSGLDGVGDGAGAMGDGESEEGTPRVEAAERQERVTALVDGVAESVFDLVSSGAGVAGVQPYLTQCIY